ncbi:hypothetical protein PF008_g20721 [Phytophthora fragariae]|uniref:Secreted protein n=1 Tax=Phytophthora fragariae TaxID=53985 RepID=A0A6G0QYX7_9STRA|nr:hypothetical protein PF008_g20721 [Phytophthora fragariae]
MLCLGFLSVWSSLSSFAELAEYRCSRRRRLLRVQDLPFLSSLANMSLNDSRTGSQGLEFSNTSNRNWQFSNCNYLLTL